METRNSHLLSWSMLLMLNYNSQWPPKHPTLTLTEPYLTINKLAQIHRTVYSMSNFKRRQFCCWHFVCINQLNVSTLPKGEYHIQGNLLFNVDYPLLFECFLHFPPFQFHDRHLIEYKCNRHMSMANFLSCSKTPSLILQQSPRQQRSYLLCLATW